MSGDSQNLYLLDACGFMTRWDPINGDSETVELTNVPADPQRIEVSHGRVAVLSHAGQKISVFDAKGRLERVYVYPGETRVTDIAFNGKEVAATTWYDECLLFVFSDPDVQPVRCIANPLYWPDASPRYRSEADVHADGSLFVVVDRLNFAVHVVDPTTAEVDTFIKERHPAVPPFEKPDRKWAGSNGDHYTGVLGATSSAAKDGSVFLVMLDRRINLGSPMGDYYLEIGQSQYGEKEWRTLVALEDRFRFKGVHFPTVLGETIYLLMPSEGVIHAVDVGD